MEFKNWLIEGFMSDLKSDADYIDPDYIWNYGSSQIPFIFSKQTGLIYSSGNPTHYWLMRKNVNDITKGEFKGTELQKVNLLNMWSSFIKNGEFRSAIKVDFLFTFGRAGYAKTKTKTNRFIISFWENCKRLIDDCVNALRNENLLPNGEDIYISMPLTGTYKYRESAPIGPKISAKELELRRNMHTMNSIDKHGALDSLGYRPRSQQVDPGVKWWASQSESKK
jgi:hypothetical protein